METIIPLIIMLIVGSLFRKKKVADEPAKDQQKPFTAQEERPNDPVKKLRDMSKEKYREIQQEMQQQFGEPTRQAPPQVVVPRELIKENPPVLVEKVSRKTQTRSSRGSRSSNSSMDRTSSSSEKRIDGQAINTSDYLPKSEQDLIKGVIFSEIFGPPKSKQ